MQAVAIAMQTAVAAYLVIAQPVYGRYRYEKLKWDAPRGQGARSRFYWGNMALKWLVAGLIWFTLWYAHFDLQAVGVQAPPDPHWRLASWIVVGLAACGVAVTVTQVWLKPDLRSAARERLASTRQMLPTNAVERWEFGAVAVTAGICEELQYRGFLLFYLAALVPALPTWAAAVLTSLAFGLGHWYQGWRGMLGTGLVGGVMALFYLLTGSLYGPMAVHALIDLQALLVSWVATRK